MQSLTEVAPNSNTAPANIRPEHANPYKTIEISNKSITWLIAVEAQARCIALEFVSRTWLGVCKISDYRRWLQRRAGNMVQCTSFWAGCDSRVRKDEIWLKRGQERKRKHFNFLLKAGLSRIKTKNFVFFRSNSIIANPTRQKLSVVVSWFNFKTILCQKSPSL